MNASRNVPEAGGSRIESKAALGLPGEIDPTGYWRRRWIRQSIDRAGKAWGWWRCIHSPRPGSWMKKNRLPSVDSFQPP